MRHPPSSRAKWKTTRAPGLSNVLVFKQTGVLPDDVIRRDPEDIAVPWRPRPPPSG